MKITLEGGVLNEETLTEKFGSDKGKLVPTDIGNIVTDFLINHFEHIMDYNFTARVEEDFDSIAVGKKKLDRNDEKSFTIIFILLLKMFKKML